MKKLILILVVLIVLIGLVVAALLFRNATLQKEIQTFGDCVDKGYPVTQGNLPECRTPDGRFFTAPLNSAEGAPPGSLHNLPVPEAVSKVRINAAELEKVDTEKVVIMSVEEKEWPDACLGISEKDLMCAQVITKGYRIVTEVNGKELIFRTNEDGSVIKREN